LRLEYNSAVQQLRTQIDNAVLANGVVKEDESSIFDNLFSLFEAEVNDTNEVTIPELLELPERPVKPIQPRPYKGAQISDLKPVVGYGLLSAGKMNIRSHYGVKKFFGVAGQGSRVLENLSYTLNSKNTEGKCDSDVKRFYFLSVYPKIELNKKTQAIIPYKQ